MYVDNIVKDSSYKLSKLIRWEIHKIDLLQYLEFDTMTSDMSLLELAKRSKACIASLQLEQHGRFFNFISFFALMRLLLPLWPI